MTDNDITKLLEAMKEVFPTAEMVKRSFDHVDARFDRIETLILADHRKRIEHLEQEVKELKHALAM